MLSFYYPFCYYRIGASWDEENWRAQYGQVIQEEAELGSGIPAVELWDWSMVKETQKGVNHEVARLVGRLVRPSRKLHPSMPSGGSRLRTAAICRVHLDLVQVRSGLLSALISFTNLSTCTEVTAICVFFYPPPQKCLYIHALDMYYVIEKWGSV